ncbi:MAG: hypothetical protein ACRYFL_09755 [Janthinobacterium lividum]
MLTIVAAIGAVVYYKITLDKNIKTVKGLTKPLEYLQLVNS